MGVATLPLRGVPLVEYVIADIEKNGSEIMGHPEPLSPAQLENLRFANGAPLPPSLLRWLAYDAAWGQLFDDLVKPQLHPLPFLQFMEEEYGEDETRDEILGMWHERSKKPFTIEQLEELEIWSDVIFFNLKAFAGDCYLLDGGSDSRRFLYVGQSDSLGEYPVLVVDIDNNPFVTVEAPGFDVYLAQHLEVMDEPQVYGANFDDPLLSSAMEAQARLNLHGFRQIEEWAYSSPWHLDGKEVGYKVFRDLMGASLDE